MILLNGSPDTYPTSSSLARTIQKLDSLLNDLRRVQSGQAPTPEELAAAPFLDMYRVSARPGPCLIGVAEGHPRLDTGAVYTSDLWALSAEGHWARTFSRFYRLGEMTDPMFPFQ